MTQDTLLAQPIYDVISNPVAINWIVGLIVTGLLSLISLLKIPKGIAVAIIKYAAKIVVAIFETEMKAEFAKEKNSIFYTGQEKNDIATGIVNDAMDLIKDNKNSIIGKTTNSVLDKTIKTLGGTSAIINVVFPIIKPFLKKIK